MTKTLESAAAPKHTELVEQLIINNVHAKELVRLKTEQGITEKELLDRLIKDKHSMFKFAIIQILVGLAALYFGFVEVNSDNDMVKALVGTVQNAAGLF